MLIFLAKVIIYKYFNAENSQPCKRWEADTRHRENVDKNLGFMLWDCEMPVSWSSKRFLQYVWAVALNSVDKYKYKRFDKCMI